MTGKNSPTSPIIKAKSNDRDKKRGGAGFLSSLLSKLGLGGGSGSSVAIGQGASYGASASAGGGVQGFFNGILATKAGVVALALTGTTIAAVVGTAPNWLGLSAPEHINFGLPKNPGANNAAGQAAADKTAADGSSQSLNYLQQANPPATPEAAPAVPAADASASASNGAQPNHDSAPNTTSANLQRPQMSASKGLGLSNASSSSGGSMAGGGSNAGAGGLGGKLSSFSGGSRASMSSLRAGTGMGSRLAGALGQARMAASNVRSNLAGGNVSSPGSGTTYDGGRAGGAIGPAGGNIGGTGASNGGQGVSGKSDPATNSTPNKDNAPPPPINNPTNAAPWQGLVNAAIAALVIAGLALAAAYFLKKTNPGLAAVASGIAAAAGAVITIIGMTLMASYGQTMMGLMWTAIGGITTVYATMQAIDDYNAYTTEVDQTAMGSKLQLAMNRQFELTGNSELSPDIIDKLNSGGSVSDSELQSSGDLSNYMKDTGYKSYQDLGNGDYVFKDSGDAYIQSHYDPETGFGPGKVISAPGTTAGMPDTAPAVSSSTGSSATGQASSAADSANTMVDSAGQTRVWNPVDGTWDYLPKK